MQVTKLDHLVLTVADIEASAHYYGEVLGMKKVIFGDGRVALAFGEQKINLHQHGAEFKPHARAPTPGSADLCFITDSNVEFMQTHLRECGIEIVDGPVRRTGALGPIESFYFYDPDCNLIEVSCYPND